ncbi:MAG TPA: hypothetical protein VML55_13475 [Planctomycetaceae bacterium]|nr:hypothetical protein [Planctomycetaceae bacterium]
MTTYLSLLTRLGKTLAALAASAMIPAAWLAGSQLHTTHYGGGCVLLATCSSGVAVFGIGWALCHWSGVRVWKCRPRYSASKPA